MRGVMVGVDESQGARLALRWAAGCARALQQDLPVAVVPQHRDRPGR